MSLSINSVEKVNREYNVNAYQVQKLSINLQIPWIKHLETKRLRARFDQGWGHLKSTFLAIDSNVIQVGQSSWNEKRETIKS